MTGEDDLLSDAEFKELSAGEQRARYVALASRHRKIITGDIVYCQYCGQWLKREAFYKTKWTKDGLEHTACKACLADMCTEVDKDGKHDSRARTIETFQRMDWYFSEQSYEKQIESEKAKAEEERRDVEPIAGRFLGIMRGFPAFNEKHFRDSGIPCGEDLYDATKSLYGIDDQDDEAAQEEAEQEEERIIKKRVAGGRKRFGPGYNDTDYQFLENEYLKYSNNDSVEDPAGRGLIETIALNRLQRRKNIDNAKLTKDLDDSFRNLLDAMKALPKQQAGTDSDKRTLGQMIREWEYDRPIPEPSDDFKDVDGIRELEMTMAGHIINGMGVNAKAPEGYDEWMERYTVHPDDEDDDGKAGIFGAQA